MARAISNQVERTPTRDRLLQATSDLLGERDTLDISLMEIAARSGLTHGLVKYHFGGKEGLLLALLERDASKALDQLARLVEADMAPLAKLELHIRGVIDVYFRFPYINRLINHLQCSPENARELSRIFMEPLRKYQSIMIEDAIEHGDIKSVDPTFFYYSAIGSCEFFFHSRNTLPFFAGYDEIDLGIKSAYADHVINLLLNGLKIAK